MPHHIDYNLIIFYAIGVLLVIGVSLTILHISSRYNLKLSIWLIYSLFFASGYMVVFQYLKYSSLHFYIDFSHWAEVLYNIAATGNPNSLSVEFLWPGGMNYLSVHFVPLIYILAIPFKIWPYGETIIGLNFLLMISAIIPLYKLALTCQKDKLFALFMPVLLLWYPTFQYLVMYEFEMLRFSIPIILWMLYYWKKKKMTGYYLFAMLAVLVREEVGLTIMMFGLYLIFIEKQRRTGLISALIGLGAFVFITQLIMPALRPASSSEHIATGLFYAFGKTPGEIIKNIILKPILTLSTVFQPAKLANVFMYFIPLLFIPLFAPLVLIATFANFSVALLVAGITRVSYMLYYLSPSIPFIFYAFIKGWPKFLAILETFPKGRFRISQSTNTNSAAMVAVLSALLAANIFFGPSPISLQFWFKDLRPAPFETQSFHYSVYKITDHHPLADKFCTLIPESAVVSAPHFLHPRLYKKKGTIIFPKLESFDGTVRAEYVLFDKTNNGLKKVSTAYRTQRDFDLVEKDKDTWELVKSEDGYYLYRRIK